MLASELGIEYIEYGINEDNRLQGENEMRYTYQRDTLEKELIKAAILF